MRLSRETVDRFIAELAREAASFPGPVVAIHGDSHWQRIDQPLEDSVGRPLRNFTRIETFGSPDIGWVDVVVDTTLAEPFRFEPNVTPRWMWW